MPEVGQRYLYGRQADFGPYHSYESVGYVGTPNKYEQPLSYPMPVNTFVQTAAMSQEYLVGTEQAVEKKGLADPGLYNGTSIMRPTDDDPAIQQQNLMLTPQPYNTSYVSGISNMNLFGQP